MYWEKIKRGAYWNGVWRQGKTSYFDFSQFSETFDSMSKAFDLNWPFKRAELRDRNSCCETLECFPPIDLHEQKNTPLPYRRKKWT